MVWRIREKNINITNKNSSNFEDTNENENIENDINNVFSSNVNKEIVLCIGKVQSGKTNKYFKSIEYAFTKLNYDICIIFGGTTISLYNQTNDRLRSKSCSLYQIPNIKFLNKNQVNENTLHKDGEKLVINILKETGNLENVRWFLNKYENKKVLIIDDESDYASVNISNNGSSTTYNNIKSIYNLVKNGKLLQITATPFANIISSKSDELKPDKIVCWSNYKNYCGIHKFNQYKDTKYETICANKSDKDSIKKAVKTTINYFIKTIILNYEYLNQLDDISCLINVELDTDSHLMCDEYVTLSLNNIKKSEIIFYNEYIANSDINYNTFINRLNSILDQIDQIILNSKSEYNSSNKKYKIFSGGTMLSRGNTFDNLICELILNSPNNGYLPVDTLLQRCRWFGNRNNIFDLMKIFMNTDIYDALLESEKYVDLLTVGIHNLNDLRIEILDLDNSNKYVRSTSKE